MYLDYYKLQSLPFRLSPDYRFFFDSRPHKKAAACLSGGLDEGRGIIVITGEIGAGKTTLVNRVLSRLRDSDLAIAKIVTPQLEGKELLRMVNAAFGLAQTDGVETEILARLESFLIECHQAGRRALLFIDEAQNLPDAALRELPALSDLQLEGEPLLQIYLIGQPEFRSVLSSKVCDELRRRVVLSHHLRSLGAAETRDYVRHRLQQAGWLDDPHLTDGAFLAIHDASGGIPRRINLLCDRLFLYAYLGELHAIDRRVVEDVMADLEAEGLVKGPGPCGRQPGEGQSGSALSRLGARGLAPGLPDQGVEADSQVPVPGSPVTLPQGSLGEAGGHDGTGPLDANGQFHETNAEQAAKAQAPLPELLLLDRIDDDPPTSDSLPGQLSAAHSEAVAADTAPHWQGSKRRWRPAAVLVCGSALLLLLGVAGAAWQVQNGGAIGFGADKLAAIWSDLRTGTSLGLSMDAGQNGSRTAPDSAPSTPAKPESVGTAEGEPPRTTSTVFIRVPERGDAGTTKRVDAKLRQSTTKTTEQSVAGAAPGQALRPSRTQPAAAPGDPPAPVTNAAARLRPAAEQGFPAAQRTLGLMYLGGSGGVSRDYAEALKWLGRAAQQGEAWAQMGLGLMYENSKGVPKSYVEAHSWYSLAAAGMPQEDQMRDNALESLERVSARMTPAQLTEAERLARGRRP